MTRRPFVAEGRDEITFLRANVLIGTEIKTLQVEL